MMVKMLLLLSLTVLPACFASILEPRKHYYAMAMVASKPPSVPHFSGLCRVRDLDIEAAYDRFQIVMRQSPFELSYRDAEVWAVKPNRMLSDMLARGLLNYNVFGSISRELSELRPDYLLSGEVYAIEIVIEHGGWFAHLDFSVQISNFDTGKTIWTFHSDKKQPVEATNFAHATAVLSGMFSETIDEMMVSMNHSPGLIDHAQNQPTPPL